MPKNAPRIPDDRAQTLVDLVDRERPILEAVSGVQIGDLLGCGRNGCVFSATDGVVKMSFSNDEAMLAKALVGPRRAPFLPVFHGGWTIKGPKIGMPSVYDFGVIHREDLADFDPRNVLAYSDAIMTLLAGGEGTDPSSALKEYDAVCRSTKRRSASRDVEAILAISGLMAWGEENGLSFDPSEFSWEEDQPEDLAEMAELDPDEIIEDVLPNAITNLGVTADGHVVIRDLGGFEVSGGQRRYQGDRKPFMDAMKRLKASVTRRNSDNDAWLYSVTWNGRLESISQEGLVPNAPEAIGRGAYRGHSENRVFLTHCDGVFFWYSRYQDHADSLSDDVLEDGMVPVVLRVKRESVTHELHEDPDGLRDALHPAWFVEGEIRPSKIEVWTGALWAPISEWEEIDPTLALDSEECEDEPGVELHYWKNSEPLRPRCGSHDST